MDWYTLPGFWGPTFETYCAHVQAINADMARTLALADAQEIWEANGQTGPAEIWFVGVYPGKIHRVDFAKYLDPDQTD